MPRPVLQSGAARKLGAALTTYSKKRPPTAEESERIANAVIEAAVSLISRELLADSVMKRCADDPADVEPVPVVEEATRTEYGGFGWPAADDVPPAETPVVES